MTNLEKLEEEADQEGIPIDTIRFESERIKGLYCDGNIALSADLQTSADRSAVLAEELGHHYTSSGIILDMNDTGNRKQELQARVWAYNRMIGLQGLIAAHRHGCRNRYEAAEYLDVTEELLEEAVNYYRGKYGIMYQVDNFVVYFEPCFGIFEAITPA